MRALLLLLLAAGCNLAPLPAPVDAGADLAECPCVAWGPKDCIARTCDSLDASPADLADGGGCVTLPGFPRCG